MQGILPVRIWGTDRDGHPFSEHVCTMDLSAKGTRLAGVRARVLVDDTVGIGYRSRKARFRVKWIAESGTACIESYVGVECVEPNKELWPINLPVKAVDPYEVPGISVEDRRKSDRRSHTRFVISGKTCVAKAGGGQGTWARLSNISLSGCYVQTGDPLTVGLRVTLLINVDHTEIEVNGVVRTSDPNAGMGVRFTHMSAADRRKLAHLIAHLEQCDPAGKARV